MPIQAQRRNPFEEEPGYVSGMISFPTMPGGRIRVRRPGLVANPEVVAPPGASLQKSNEEMPDPGDARVAAAAGAQPEQFDYMLDPMIQRILKNQEALETLQDRAKMIEATYRPSKLRNILGTIAGVGLGALTLNPDVGAGVKAGITKAPLYEELSPIQREIAVRQARGKELGEISGLGATLQQRRADLTQAGAQAEAARAAAVRAAEDAAAGEYGRAHPEMETLPPVIPPGATTPVIQRVPRRQGATTPETMGAPAPEASAYELKPSSDGKALLRVDKTTGQAETIKMPEGFTLPPPNLSDMEAYADAFMKLGPTSPQIQAMNEYLQQSRPNFSLAAGEAARSAADEETRRAEAAAAAIAAEVTRKGITDQGKAYEEFIKILDNEVRTRPGMATVADKIRSAGRARYPRAGSAPQQNRNYQIGDVKKQTEAK